MIARYEDIEFFRKDLFTFPVNYKGVADPLTGHLSAVWQVIQLAVISTEPKLMYLGVSINLQ